MSEKQDIINALNVLGQHCLKNEDFDTAAALGTVAYALKCGRIKELADDMLHLAQKKNYMSEETAAHLAEKFLTHFPHTFQ